MTRQENDMIKSFCMPTRIVYGCGAISQLPGLLNEYGFSSAVIACGAHFKGKAEALCESSVQIKGVYANIKSDPALQGVAELAATARRCKAECIIAIGGGSVIDTGKMASAIVNSTVDADAYFCGTDIPANGIALIAVPTTSGTGSEMSKAAVITVNGEKKTLFSDSFQAKAALIDPELTLSLNPRTTMVTGLDAMTHALEAIWSVRHQTMSDIYAERALRYSVQNLEKAFIDGTNIEARVGMSYASMMAGIAFSQTKNAGVHACSYPLTEMLHMPHGEACAFTLPEFIAINSDERLESICTEIGLCGTEELISTVRRYQAIAGLHTRLSEFGDVDIPKLAAECEKQPLMQFNPVKMDRYKLEELFTSLL